MANSWSLIRRSVAIEMALWGGSVDGSAPGPGTFSNTDPNGSLYVVYDVNRPEPDDEWNGAYVCINPGGTGNASLSTIWRRIADDSGFINSTGALTLTSPLPSIQYAATTMTYELFKSFTPEQWMMSVNYATRNSYPQRHRLVAFEAPEDPETVFYDWGNLVSSLAIADPISAPTVNVITDPGGSTNNWATGTYKIAYNYYNSAGETLVSPTTSISLTSGKIIEIEAITVPEQAVGVNYFCTPDPGGSILGQFSVGNGVLPNPSPDNTTQMVGLADPTTFIVPAIRFWQAPIQLNRTNPKFNTTGLDTAGLSLKNVKRRLNPGQFPEHYIDLNPSYWREVGGTVIKVESRATGNSSLRFECQAPVRALTSELDTSAEPLEILISGAMFYLWNQLLMTGSAQNVDAWKAEVKEAEARFTKARNLYQMPGPRKTFRRPYIRIVQWQG